MRQYVQMAGYYQIMTKPLLLALMATVVFACESDYAIWIPRSKSADPLYRFVKNGKAGYIDRTGRIVIPPRLERYGNYGSEFHDGLLEIAVSDGRYIDRTGKVVIDKVFYRGWDFSEGLAVAMRKGENLWGYIDTSGEFVISPRFETYPNGYVSSFSEGVAMVEVKGRVGYIDRSGEFVIKPQFLDGTSFSDGMARVVTDGPCFYFPEGGCGLANPRSVGGQEGGNSSCKFTFIDKTGRVITQQRFEDAHDFSEGLASVRIGELWGFIDKAGKVVIPPTFEYAGAFSSGLALIREGELSGYADKSGTIVVVPQYEYAEGFSEGFAVVGDGEDHYWYIDGRGRQTIREEFATASPFFKGVAHVDLLSKDGIERHAYIDRTGRHIFTYY
jgi:hypothetical protein